MYHRRTPRESRRALRESRSDEEKTASFNWSFNSLKQGNFHYVQLPLFCVF